MVTQVGFVQLTVSSLERALSLYAGRLGMVSRRMQTISGAAIETLWNLPNGTRVRLADLVRPGREEQAGIRLIECSPSGGEPLRLGVPTSQAGPFGFSIGSLDVPATAAILGEFGGEMLSKPQHFPPPPGRNDEGTVEVVVRMQAGYCVTVFQTTTGSDRYGQPGAQGLTEVVSASVISGDAARTHHFWQDLLGMQFAAITEGVNDGWNTVRAIPAGTSVRTGHFRSLGSSGRIYRAYIPGLSDQSEATPPAVGIRGFCLVGVRVENPTETAKLAAAAGFRTIARATLDLAPWGTNELITVEGPDGLIVELGPAGEAFHSRK